MPRFPEKKHVLPQTYIWMGTLLGLLSLFFFIAAGYRTFEIRSQLDAYELDDIRKETNAADRLLLYWLYAKYEPLFAIPEADLIVLRENIALLDARLQEVAGSYTKEEGQQIKESLHSIHFLHEIAELEERRKKLLAAPSDELAELYHAQLIRTIRSYTSAALKANEVFKSFDNKTIAFMSGTTSAASVSKKLDSLVAQANTTIELESKRYNCMQFSLLSCINLTGDTGPHSRSNSKAAVLPIDEKMYEFKDIIDSLYTVGTASSTLIVLDESSCYPYEQPIVYAYWNEKNPLFPSLTFPRATPVNDLFLFDLTDPQTFTINNFYRSLANAGVTHSLQPMNLYFCIDSGQEYQKLASIKRIEELIRTIGSIPTEEMPDLLSDALELRLSFFDDAVIHETVVEKYITIIDELFESNSEKEILKHIDRQTYDTLRRISLLGKTNSADLEELINTAVYMTETSREILEYIDIPIDQLYLTRSYLSLLFLTGNETIYGGEFSFLAQKEAQPIDSFMLISAKEQFPQTEDKKNLKNMLQDSYRKRAETIN